MSIFDFVVSYQRNNGISWVYDGFEPITPGTDPQDFWSPSDVVRIIDKKSKPILILVSHCYTHSRREYYIEALSQYLPVTNYGYCSGITCDENCASQAFEEHYFYLAFENSVCNDYVTEKFWHMKRLIVPIVLSRRAVGDAAPSGSFIAVDDFTTAAELASYLIFLMEDKEEYSKAQDGTTTSTTNGEIPGLFATLSPGMVINVTLLSQRPDENALNSLLSYLPEAQRAVVRNIRGNIFLTLDQQNDQILDYLSEQRGNASDVYEEIQNKLQELSRNITNSISSLSSPARSFVQRRQGVLDNTIIALFDYNARLTGLVNEYNMFNNSLKNEIYNFLVTRQINGEYVPNLNVTTSVPVKLDEAAENLLMNLMFFDGANQPIRGFVQLIPQEQQNQFNNIINNSNLKKEQIDEQLRDLVTGWGTQYEIAYNNTLIQRNQLVQLLMFLSPGLMEPYKSFVDKKIKLMNNMTLTNSQESQSTQSLVNGFRSARTTLKNYVNGTESVLLGR